MPRVSVCRIPLDGVGAAAQQQSATTTPPPTFRASTKLIVTTVVVRNPDGTPVEGLTADDFVVTEDNEPQEIAFVEYQRLDNLRRRCRPCAARRSRSASAGAAGGAVSSIVTPGITVPPSGDGTVSQPAPDHPVLRPLRIPTTRPRSACSPARRPT